MNTNNINAEVLGFFLPLDTLKWFDIVDGSKDDIIIKLVLEEKNIPPIPTDYNNEKITSKGFKEITISDYPIRGRKVLLTFRRRYWQMEGQKELLKNNIKLTAEGTLLEKEFADFLKE